jgi:hypothetical protein
VAGYTGGPSQHRRKTVIERWDGTTGNQAPSQSRRPQLCRSYAVISATRRAEDRTWGLYAGLAELAGATDPFAVPHPDVTAGALHGPNGGLIVLTNHGPARLDVPIKAPEGAVPGSLIRTD